MKANPKSEIRSPKQVRNPKSETPAWGASAIRNFQFSIFNWKWPLLLALCLSPFSFCLAAPLGSAFTYQGRLHDGAGPANGIYDLRFTLNDAATGLAQIGNALTNAATGVSNGLFTVTLDFGPGVFTGAARWLEIGVRTNGPGAFITLAPRQALTPTPYAVYAPSAGTATTAGTATAVAPGSVGMAGLAVGAVDSSRIADGSIALGDLSPTLASNTFWRLGGNAGTAPGTQFLGTTDNQPLELQVSNQRGLRLESLSNLVNVIGGHAANLVTSAAGATVAGGGSNGLPNTIAANFGSIGGGASNAIGTGATAATVAGGWGNSIQSNAIYATIAGGQNNEIQGSTNEIAARWGFLGGGLTNIIEPYGYYASLLGGVGNRIQYDGDGTVIGGGSRNLIGTNADQSVIAGGANNVISPNAIAAAIPGGAYNVAGGSYAFAAGLRAKANHRGTFVWADSQGADFASTTNNQFLIRVAGGVGINKNSPATALDVNGTVTATGFSGPATGLTGIPTSSLADNSVTAAKLANDAASLYKVSGSTLSTDSNGRIVVDPGNLNSGSVISSALNFGLSSGEGIASQRTAGVNQWGLDLFTSFQPRLSIANNGNVGIGTTSPLTPLHVVTPDLDATIRAEALAAGRAGLLEMFAPGGHGALFFGGSNYSFWGGPLSLNLINAADGPLTFGHYLNNSPVERLRITSAGKVGIGKTDPATMLDVNGTITATSFAGSGGILSLGTTDTQPLELRVNNQRLLRLELGYMNNPNVIAGSPLNSVSSDSGASVVAGGYSNTVAFANYAAMGGGQNNRIEGGHGAFIGAGWDNRIGLGGVAAVIAGGRLNTISNWADYATIPGGMLNVASAPLSLAAGYCAVARHTGSFVWADATGYPFTTPFTSTASNQFLIRASGGVGIGKANPTSMLDVNGTVTAQSFAGNIPAANLTGFIADARLSANVARLNADQTFTGQNTFSHLNAADAGAQSGILHVGGYGANGDPKLIYFGDGAYVYLGEYGMDDTMELRAARFFFNNGNVGLGAAPGSDRLDIHGSTRINENDIYLRSGTDNNHGVGWYGNIKPFAGQNIDGPVLYGWSGGALGTTGNGQAVALKWNSAGNVTIAKTLTIAGGSDVAEPFPMSTPEIPKGSVVVIDDEHPGQLKQSERAYDTRVAGIVSGANGINPGLSLHQEGALEGGQQVALTGRVYVRADATNGAIKPGDLLTTADLPGHAMKVTDHTRSQGAVLGKAMTALAEGQGMVLVLVTLQ